MTDQCALEHLKVYADGRLDPEDAIEVDALLERYLQGMLDPDTVTEIERAIDADRRLADMVEEARRGGAWLDVVLAPKARSFLDQPLSPAMVKFTEDVIAGRIPAEPDQGDDDKVVRLQPPAPAPEPARRPWLMAASIAGLLIAGGTGAYFAKSRLDDAASRQSALEQEVDQLTAERDGQQGRIGDLDSQVAGLLDDLFAAETAKAQPESQIAEFEGRQSNLEQQVADLQGEIAASTDRVRQLDQQRATLTGEVDQLQARAYPRP